VGFAPWSRRGASLPGPLRNTTMTQCLSVCNAAHARHCPLARSMLHVQAQSALGSCVLEPGGRTLLRTRPGSTRTLSQRLLRVVCHQSQCLACRLLQLTPGPGHHRRGSGQWRAGYLSPPPTAGASPAFCIRAAIPKPSITSNKDSPQVGVWRGSGSAAGPGRAWDTKPTRQQHAHKHNVVPTPNRGELP
jgi:hypothetical protein